MNATLRLLLRGFLLESIYDARGRQRAGFAWITGRTDLARREPPFNTNPILAGYATGLVDAGHESAFERHRTALESALGGLGDRLVWGILRPAAVCAGWLLAPLGVLPASLALLLVYNPAELGLRIRSIRAGREGIERVGRDIGARGLGRVAARWGRAVAFLAGAAGGSFVAGSWIAGGPVEGCVAGAGIVLAAASRRSTARLLKYSASAFSNR